MDSILQLIILIFPKNKNNKHIKRISFLLEIKKYQLND